MIEIMQQGEEWVLTIDGAPFCRSDSFAVLYVMMLEEMRYE